MSRRIALVLSAALTAVVLVALGAAIGRSTGRPAESSLPPDLIDAFEQREAAYRQLVASTNAAGEPAPREAPARSAAAEPAGTSEPVGATPRLSPAEAASIALAQLPQARMLQAPERVVFEGHDAYEVLLDAGPLYIDANDGRLLTDLVTASVQKRRSDDDDEHHERERHHDDDDD